jgi:hypothetical protein
MFLDTPFAGDFRRMVREAAALGSREWAEGGASRLAEASRGLADRALGAGCGVYKAPFPERPDILVLDGPDRKRPLINV